MNSLRTVRAEEFARVPLPPEQLEMLVRMQYQALRNASYAMQYPSGNDIILYDGKAVGRIWIYQGGAEHRLVDIALLPEYRNFGIGSELVKAARSAAWEAGMPLTCSVAVDNAASLRFHERLGFRIVGRDEVYCDLSAEPPAESA